MSKFLFEFLLKLKFPPESKNFENFVEKFALIENFVNFRDRNVEN